MNSCAMSGALGLITRHPLELVMTWVHCSHHRPARTQGRVFYRVRRITGTGWTLLCPGTDPLRERTR